VGAENERIADAIRSFSPVSRPENLFGGGDASLRIRSILTGFQDARSG